MADPRVVTGFHPDWKDLVYPIVVDRSRGARLWDLDGNEYIDLLSCFGGNLLGYQPQEITSALKEQIDAGMEVGPQHPLAAEVASLIAEFTGMERVAFCNTGSEAVMGAMRIARTVTGRKTIAIFSNSYHGIFDEVVVRGSKQLRSLSAAPGILANAVENILVLDWASDASLEVLRSRGHELAAIMTEPIQNKYPTLQPREFLKALRRIADDAGCALIFDEVVTGFRVAPGGAQEFYRRPRGPRNVRQGHRRRASVRGDRRRVALARRARRRPLAIRRRLLSRSRRDLLRRDVRAPSARTGRRVRDPAAPEARWARILSAPE